MPAEGEGVIDAIRRRRKEGLDWWMAFLENGIWGPTPGEFAEPVVVEVPMGYSTPEF